jgi:Tol biopolymer transport system component
MPEVRDVYEMVTKQKTSEPGALERQQRRQVRTARNKRIGAFAVAAAIAAAAVVLVLVARPGEDATTPADNPPSVAPGEPFFLDLETGEKTPLPENLAGGYSYVASPDGTRLAYSSKVGGGCAKGADVMIASIDGTDVQRLESPEGLDICGARWSPDGTRLVYQERNGADAYDVGNVFVHDLSTGERTRITDLELTEAWWWFLSPRFSPAGAEVLPRATGPGNVIFHMPRDSSETTKWDVWSVPVTGGEPTLVLRNAAFPMLRAQGPEGLRIQFVLPRLNDFAGLSIMTGRPSPGSDIRQTLADAPSSIWWPTMSPDGNKIAYQVGGSIYVVDVRTGEVAKVANGNTAEWLDVLTLIVAP